MNGTEDVKPAALPIFYREIAVLDSIRHAALRLDRGRDFGFAAKTNAVLLALNEFAVAAADYPIVFAAAGRNVALAIVGFRDSENLFVDAAGAWQPGSYVPAYARNYPFALIEQPGGAQLTLAIDPTASCFSETAGTPLFAEGKPTPALSEAMEFCIALHQSYRATTELCAALDAAGLLVENQAQIQFKQGGTASLRGFRVIDHARFQALDDQRFLEWRRRGWLAPIYAHLQSLGRWAKIVELGAQRLGPAPN